MMRPRAIWPDLGVVGFHFVIFGPYFKTKIGVIKIRILVRV